MRALKNELQVLALAPGDQHLRDVAGAVEGEVPDARVRADPVENGRARQRSVDHDEVGHLVAVRLRVGVGDHQPDVVPDDRTGSSIPRC